MSNKPKIYANCKAGCLWETVHKDDFERSASIIALQKEGGLFRLEPLKTYRIEKNPEKSLVDSNYGFTITLNYTIGGTDYSAILYDPDDVPLQDTLGQYYNFDGAYREFLTVRLCSLYYYSGGRIAAIEYDGKIFQALAASTGASEGETYENVRLTVSGAGACYLYNEHAEILLKGVPEVTEADNGKILGVVDGGLGFVTMATDEIPTFNLGELGLPAVTIGETAQQLATDTADIMAALDKGAVKFIVNFKLGTMEAPAEIVLNKLSVGAAGVYICSCAFDNYGEPMIFNLYIEDGNITAYFTILPTNALLTTNINLSAYETDGQIVETYEDGSTKTTTVEFDTDGNPIKITDGDGNVTTLTW